MFIKMDYILLWPVINIVNSSFCVGGGGSGGGWPISGSGTLIDKLPAQLELFYLYDLVLFTKVQIGILLELHSCDPMIITYIIAIR